MGRFVKSITHSKTRRPGSNSGRSTGTPTYRPTGVPVRLNTLFQKIQYCVRNFRILLQYCGHHPGNPPVLLYPNSSPWHVTLQLARQNGLVDLSAPRGITLGTRVTFPHLTPIKNWCKVQKEDSRVECQNRCQPHRMNMVFFGWVSNDRKVFFHVYKYGYKIIGLTH